MQVEACRVRCYAGEAREELGYGFAGAEMRRRHVCEIIFRAEKQEGRDAGSRRRDVGAEWLVGECRRGEDLEAWSYELEAWTSCAAEEVICESLGKGECLEYGFVD